MKTTHKLLALAATLLITAHAHAAAAPARYDWIPEAPNHPIGIARGIYPGRVVWAHDPAAAHWNGDRSTLKTPWWSDASTDQTRVDAMLATTLLNLTGAQTPADAWRAIFTHYNKTTAPLHGITRPPRGYQPGEIVAIKVNLNSTSAREPRKDSDRHDASTDITPQTVLALVRQLVNNAHVAQNDILIYDAKRIVYTALLQKIWNEFPDIRFLQERPLVDDQRHPKYHDYSRIEQPKWVTALTYSNPKIKNDTRNRPLDIPQQVLDATYSINLALLKAHSYPYGNLRNMEKGDEGQTAVTMTGKNYFGSIQGPSALHAYINPSRESAPKSYNPLVDLAASPALGAKTILYLLDGLYSARKHSSAPIHFTQPPFNSKNYPYENPEWPSSILASLDGVALDSVGLDILYSQTVDNIDRDNKNRPWLILRENADTYLHEMALAPNPPSGTHYTQPIPTGSGSAGVPPADEGRPDPRPIQNPVSSEATGLTSKIQNSLPVPSLGVHEHWNDPYHRQYTRNLDPQNGQGIELLYLRATPDTDTTKSATAPASTTARQRPIQNPQSKIQNFSPPPLPRRTTSQGLATARLPQYQVEQRPANWAIATAESVMARYPDYREAYWKPWNYVTGYMLTAFEMLYNKTHDQRYYDYIKTYIDHFVTPDGRYTGDKPTDNLDNIMTGTMIVALYERTHDPRYQKAAEVFRHAFDDYPRNPDGGFWHGRTTIGQMWIDGIFMGQMFLTRYGAVFNDPAAFDEAANQILIYSKHEKITNGHPTGLFYHGWTSRPELKDWADKTTGHSTDVWAEGLGWYALIISKTLELMPPSHPKRPALIALEAKLAAGLAAAQDPATGGWWNIVDKGNQPGNFIDPSGTAMFTYMLKTAITAGRLDPATYTPILDRGYSALLTLARINEHGLVDVWGGCDGVGIQKNYDGYAARRRMVNAKETYAGFLWATTAMENFSN